MKGKKGKNQPKRAEYDQKRARNKCNAARAGPGPRRIDLAQQREQIKQRDHLCGKEAGKHGKALRAINMQRKQRGKDCQECRNPKGNAGRSGVRNEQFGHEARWAINFSKLE